MRDIDPAELNAMLRSPPPGLQLLDVRLPWEHVIARIPGGTLIPMHEIPRRMRELDAARPVVVYCHHGIRSRQVAVFLEEAGFQDVLNLDGGIDSFADSAGGTIPKY